MGITDLNERYLLYLFFQLVPKRSKKKKIYRLTYYNLNNLIFVYLKSTFIHKCIYDIKI